MRSSDSAITANVTPEIVQTPAASPSTPSERQRERLDPHAGSHRDRGRGHLPGQLDRRRQVVEVVERTHYDHQERAAQDAAGLAVERHEDKRPHEDTREDRQPAQPWHRRLVQIPVSRQVDRAHAHGEARGEGRDDQRDDGRDRESRDRLDFVHPTLSVSSGRD
jgi:hypothetical protein